MNSSDVTLGIRHNLLSYIHSYIFTYLLTYIFHGSESLSRATNRSQPVKKFPTFGGTRRCLLPVPTLSQLDPVHTPTSHFLKIHLQIYIPSTPGSSMWSLFRRFFPTKPCTPLSSTPYVLHVRPPHSSRFDHQNNTG